MEATECLGDIAMHICTWSGMRCPSRNLPVLLPRQCMENRPQLLTRLPKDRFPPGLWARTHGTCSPIRSSDILHPLATCLKTRYGHPSFCQFTKTNVQLKTNSSRYPHPSLAASVFPHLLSFDLGYHDSLTQLLRELLPEKQQLSNQFPKEHPVVSV